MLEFRKCIKSYLFASKQIYKYKEFLLEITDNFCNLYHIVSIID